MHGWCKQKLIQIEEACKTKRESRTFEWLLKKVHIFRKKKLIPKISNKVKITSWLMEEKTFRDTSTMQNKNKMS